MVVSVSAVALIGVSMTVLMIAAMLYLVWGALDSDIHSPSPGESEQPELDDDESGDTEEPQSELPEGSSA
ncbi:hypothetical protein BRD22_12155 [Halobacteriales archaeon SW_8_68_21]|nr:MAG: hypothetical protein BRD22_12155 [Halobacteriales archaeon SW_8_68_21]